MIVLRSALNLGFLKNYPKQVQDHARTAVAETAKELVDKMKGDAPRDTGALAEGIYYVTKSYHGYQDALARAAPLRPGVDHLGPIPGTNSDFLSKIGFTQPYWSFVAHGTVHNRAQDFITPALENGKEIFRLKMDKAMIAAAKAAGAIKVIP